MSLERRKNRRMDLSVAMTMRKIVDKSDSKNIIVQVVNLSRNGIGFESNENLAMDECYNTQITIWTKEIIPAIVKIIRKTEEDGIYSYGGIFVGMTNSQAIKIDIYDVLHEE